MNSARRNSRKKSVSFAFTVFIGAVITGGTVLAQSVKPAVPNTIQQDTALYRFFEALQQADSNVVSILHLGDSHIQAGSYPVATGAALQKEFGNAGRGWTFPYNLAGTNGPDDYRWNSTVRWQTDKVIDRYKEYAPGPGAIVITTGSKSPALYFNGRSVNGLDDAVSRAQLFYDAGSTEGSVLAPGAAVTITPAPFVGTPTLSKATLEFRSAVQSFQTRWDNKGTGPFLFYGAIIQNGSNGVLYHAIGINGAMFQHYMDNPLTLTAQMQVLQPQLVIISLGTNEAYSGLSATAITAQIDSTVHLLRQQQPDVPILLTTPPECMRTTRKAFRKKVGQKYRTYYRVSHYPNPAIGMVTQQIVQYCRDNGLACWNFNALNKAMKSSFAAGWAPDHIHFNARGYQLQGRLLYEALQQAYKAYLENHGKDI
ncbi:GDSL-type esterase/lipase family protein [uncultured Chitinophaga sp.]|jgi:GDSL-like Lipase/Acylhydrolase.|uniref:GDSL-type esterase/lipase family protein n=1 Tax=uncultured Chitinophaga sp. TaxID=339340 RepID=UPI00262F2E8E|nr:GDSL-type esterase/lipase family protein [uncultured Chitinophaga sp.]